MFTLTGSCWCHRWLMMYVVCCARTNRVLRMPRTSSTPGVCAPPASARVHALFVGWSYRQSDCVPRRAVSIRAGVARALAGARGCPPTPRCAQPTKGSSGVKCPERNGSGAGIRNRREACRVDRISSSRARCHDSVDVRTTSIVPCAEHVSCR